MYTKVKFATLFFFCGLSLYLQVPLKQTYSESKWYQESCCLVILNQITRVLPRLCSEKTNRESRKCVEQCQAVPGVPVVFCGTPQLSWQPSRSLPKDDRPQHSRSMMHAVLDGAAAAGTVSPEEEGGCHFKIFLHERSVQDWSLWLASCAPVKHAMGNYRALLITFIFTLISDHFKKMPDLLMNLPCTPPGLSFGFARGRDLVRCAGCPCPTSEHCGNTW